MQESRLALSLLCGTVFRRRYSRAKNGEARDLVFMPFNSCNGNLPGARSRSLPLPLPLVPPAFCPFMLFISQLTKNQNLIK